MPTPRPFVAALPTCGPFHVPIAVPRLTPDQVVQLVDAYQRGASTLQLSRQLKRQGFPLSRQGVANILTGASYARPTDRGDAPILPPLRTFKKQRKEASRTLTPDQLTQIALLKGRGAPIPYIAGLFGVSRETILESTQNE